MVHICCLGEVEETWMVQGGRVLGRFGKIGLALHMRTKGKAPCKMAPHNQKSVIRSDKNLLT